MDRGVELICSAAIGLATWAFVINPTARFIGETLPAWTLAMRGAGVG